MTQNKLRSVVTLSLGFVVLTAAAVSAHSTAREIRSTWITLERAATIVHQVLTDRNVPDVHLKQGDVAALRQESTPPPPPAGPAAPAVPGVAPPPRPEQPPRPAAPPRAPGRVVPVPPAPPEPPEPIEFEQRQNVRPVVRIGQGVTVGPSDEVSDVVVVGGPLRVEGHVRGDVVVVLGTVYLAETSVIDGDFVNVAGGVTAQPGAKVEGDMVTVGGAFNGPPGFTPSGEQMVIGSDQIGRRIQAFIPWVTQGLMWGRLIVPSLPWVWVFVGVTFLLSLLLSVLFEPAVRSCAMVVSARPLTSFLYGVLVLLLLGPVSVILAVSVVGIIVLPFLFCALLVGAVVGKIAVARWLGFTIIPEDEDDGRLAAVRSVAIGLIVITLVYMVPVLGLVTWTLLTVLGLGAATSALFKALRRENPAAPKPPKPVAPAPVPPPQPTVPFTADGGAEPAAYAAAPTYTTPVTPPQVAPGLSYAQATDPAGAELLALPRATLPQRVAAGALDVFLVGIIFSMLEFRRQEAFWFFTLLTAYNAAFWTWRGTTIGGIILQLRVVRLDGRPMVFGDSVVRGLSSVFSLLVFGLGFFWIRRSGNTDRQAWHDLIAGTVVVAVPRSVPLR